RVITGYSMSLYDFSYHAALRSFPTRRSSDLMRALLVLFMTAATVDGGLGYDVATSALIYGLYTSLVYLVNLPGGWIADRLLGQRSEEHTSELQSRENLVCRLLLEKKKIEYYT